MKQSRILAVLMAVIMVWMSLCIPFAVADAGNISLFYMHIKRVNTTLTISGSGQATCTGIIATASQSEISMTLTLYKKSGNSWVKVTSWNSDQSGLYLKMQKSYSISQGTYKVVASGSVTTDGNTERFSTTSNQVTYPAQ